MFKNKLNYKLINILLFGLLLFLIYQTYDLWDGIMAKIFDIILPFALAFIFAYAVYPIYKWLEKKGIHKVLSIIIIYTSTILIIGGLIWFSTPLIIDQITALVTSLLDFITLKSAEYNIDMTFIQENLTDFSSLIKNISETISTSFMSFIAVAIDIITTGMIALIVSVYFLLGMDKTRASLKKHLKKRNTKSYNYVRKLDIETKNYFVGLLKYIGVQFVQYTLVYYLIGHPYFLLMGILASITTIIPYFGGMIAGAIAMVTAAIVSPGLLIATIIVSLIFPNIDAYVTSPYIYGKSSKIPTMWLIFSVLALGQLFGIIGIIISLPLTIILVTTFRFYRNEIEEKIDNIKESMH